MGKDSGPSQTTWPALSFSTAAFSKKTQRDAYNAFLGSTFALTPPALGEDEAGFEAEGRVHHIGRLALLTCHSSKCDSGRNLAMIRRDGLDHWCFMVPTSGLLLHEIEGRERVLQPGEMALQSLATPIRFRHDKVSAVMLFVPRDELHGLNGGGEGHADSVMQNGLATVFVSHLRFLSDAITSMPPHHAGSLGEMTLRLLEACLPPLEESASVGSQGLTITRRRMVEAYINRNLTSNELTPEAIQLVFRLSRSGLYRLFESTGGILRYIQVQRLRAARDALADPRDMRRIQEIGYAFGFGNAPDFSRAFRRAFGYSPSEVREAGSVTGALIPAMHPRGQGATLAEWLQGLELRR